MNAKYEILTESGIQLSGLSNINENLSTHYLIYRIDNIINGKYYIGQHKTNNPYDDYMGSGNLICNAINKYKLSSFVKTIMFDYNNFDDMNNKESELVQLSNCNEYDKMSYNIRIGGAGKHSEDSKQKISESRKLYFSNMSKEERQQKCKHLTEWHKNASDEEYNNWKKNVHNSHMAFWKSENGIQAKKERSLRATGKNNPMYGKSIFDNMSKENRQKYHDNMSKASVGRCHMYHPITHKNVNPKKEKIEEYLALGYVFGQYNKTYAGKKIKNPTKI